MTNLDDFIKESKAHHYVEVKIINKIIKALNDADNPIVSVYDGDENTPVTPGNKREIDRLVYNLDECFLYTKSGGWVRIALGEDWDCLPDYTLDLEDTLKPINDFIDTHSN